MEKKNSIFGALLLIAAGVTWLLIQSGKIPPENLWALTHVWPFILIVAGLGLMLKPFWKFATVVLDVVLVGGLVLAIVYAPRLGWNEPSIFSMFENGGLIIGPGVSGSGNVIKETREVSGFDSVNVEYPAKVLITQGKTESLKIEGEDNVLPNLMTQVKNGTLNIFYKKTGDKNINPTKLVVITITVKDLKEVEFSSAGELTIDGVKTDNLDMSLSGAGSMTASGMADDLDVNISGFGDFNGADLHSKTAYVNISGAGSATVWVEEELDADISGAGSVNYYGSPNINKQVNGVGGVNHKGNK